MKFYLSSYGIGDEAEKLRTLLPADKRKIGYIPNALDFSDVDVDSCQEHINKGVIALQDLDYDVELLDLRDYFQEPEKLEKKLEELDGVFVNGGNTFILRQAMKLSGFDVLFKKLLMRDDFLYSGYSAGICVLAKSLKSLKYVDDHTDRPYGINTVWEGLGYLDYIILPHFNSDHPESGDIAKVVIYCKEHNIAYKTLSDGEVIILE
ncbi:MAG: dipeptidase E [Candidatus Woesearchaeota archaeon]|jgi:dipeptidase E